MSKIFVGLKGVIACCFSFLIVSNSLWAEPIAIIVHPSNSVEDIPVKELKNIFSGRKTQWDSGTEIGVVNRHATSEIRKQFYTVVLGAEPTRKFYLPGTNTQFQALIQESEKAAQLFVARSQNAISYVYMSEVTQEVKVVKIDGLTPTDDGYVLK